MNAKTVKIASICIVLILAFIPMMISKNNQIADIVQVHNSCGVLSYIVEVNNTDVVFIKLSFKNAGTRHNLRNEHGISCVASDWLFYHIDGMSKNEVDTKMLLLGIDDFSITCGDNIEISFIVLKEKIDEALKFVSNAFALRETNSDRLEEIKQSYPCNIDLKHTSYSKTSFNKLQNLIYADTGYGLNNTGCSDAINTISFQSVENFIKQHIVKENLSVFFAGNVSRFDVNKYLDILCKHIKSNEELSDKRKTDHTNIKITKHNNKDCLVTYMNNPDMKDIAYISFGMALDKTVKAQTATLGVLMPALFGDGGDFVAGLRKNNIAYGINCHLLRMSYSNLVLVGILVDAKDVKRTVEYIRKKISEYRSRINFDRINTIKRYINMRSTSWLTSFDDIIENTKFYNLPFDDISSKDIESVNADLCDPTKIYILVLSSASNEQ